MIIITDGNPTDSEYDPSNLYAHYDVRKACEENRAQDVNVFCISTGEDNPAVLSRMFPGDRFAAVSNVSDLPHVLARQYIKLSI